MRRALLIGLLLPALLMVARGGNIQSSNAGLEEGFNHPGDAFRPWVNWFWLDGNITREGITADLEAMAREGIGGAVLMGDVSQEIPAGPVQFDSPEWDALFQHAVRVAARLGLKIRLHNTPGWSGSGGPWITPALSMQKVVWARTNLIGPAHYEGPAPRPLSNLGYEQFIAAEAFPALPGKGGPPPDFHPDIVLGRGAEGAANALLDDNPATTVRFDHPSERSPAFIELRFGAPFAASRLILQSHGGLRQAQGRLEVSDDGGSFHKVRDFLGNAGELELNFELVQARRFRIAFTSPPLNSRFVEVSGIQLAAVYQLEHHQGKTGMTRVPPPPLKHPRVPFSAMVHETNMIDLSSKVTATGRLEWDVPPGVWTVVTFASAPVGMTNHPPTPRGLGLECDKLSKVAIETHFDAFLKKEIAAAGDNAGKAFSGAHIDSWEVGLQNWTADFPQEFQKRRGYSLLPFLPAYAGEIVESPQICDRFFWDVRRTIAELEADNYAGALAELVHRYGMKLSIEAYGNGPFNDLLYASKADVPMGEFWTERENAEKFAQCKSMAAAAHVFGKPIVDVEAFTSFPSDSSWQCHPFSLKPLADTALCNGVTRFVFHCYAHQPWLDLKPGMTMGSAGAHYDRNNTWWNYSRPWHEYIARCQFLLRQGRFKADICYVTPEGAYFSPPTRHTLNPPLPDGYDYDVAPPEALFSRFSVANGRITLPGGMSYGVLVLPQVNAFTPRFLGRVHELLNAGAVVVGGPRPESAPGLSNYPQCDSEARFLAHEIWGDSDGKTPSSHKVGKGAFFTGLPLSSVLVENGMGPDFTQSPKNASSLHWIHRATSSADIYFVANSNLQPVSVECGFRIKGKQPELWDPATGSIEKTACWTATATNTIVPLRLDPAGSVFVVFQKASDDANAVAEVNRDGRPDREASLIANAGSEVELRSARSGRFEIRQHSGEILRADIQVPEPISLKTGWCLKFPPATGFADAMQIGSLRSWTKFTEPALKFFSGAAIYSTEITVPPDRFAPGRHLMLDLGDVEVIAKVSINGDAPAILWKPPFVLDVSTRVHAGTNVLAVEVVNLWPNRLIGDEQLPEDCQWESDGNLGQHLTAWPGWLRNRTARRSGRKGFATWRYWKKDSPLFPSGLLGPVTLRCEDRVELPSEGRGPKATPSAASR